MSSLERYFEAYARLYDPLIDWDHREPFEKILWRRILERWPATTALDCACGTGFHVQLMTRLGVRTFGCDFSRAMIERARERTRESSCPLDFRVLRWEQMAAEYAHPFDMVICAGNSLAYVESKAARARAVDQMLACVRPGGTFVVECLNYERLVEEKPPFLPGFHHEREDGAKLDIGYVLTYREGAVDMHLFLVNESGGNVTDRMNHVRTYTVLREPFADYLRRAGCVDVQFFSGDIDSLVVFDEARDRHWYCVAVKGS